jgi:hypothetical protein
LCKKCSEGIPHEHHHNDIKKDNIGTRRIALASAEKNVTERILKNWEIITLREYRELVLEL